MQINKFTYTKDEFGDALLYIAIIAIVAKLASNISNTPIYIAMLIISIIAFMALLYFSFFEKRKVVLDKWLAKSSIVFLGFSLLNIVALGDYYLFGIF